MRDACLHDTKEGRGGDLPPFHRNQLSSPPSLSYQYPSQLGIRSYYKVILPRSSDAAQMRRPIAAKGAAEKTGINLRLPRWGILPTAAAHVY